MVVVIKNELKTTNVHKLLVMDLKTLAESNDPLAIELIQTIYSWIVGMDMMENIAIEVEKMGKKGYNPKGKLKNKGETFIKVAKEFNKRLKHELGVDEQAEKFGATADFLQQLFEICIFIKPDDRINVLSMAKLMVKK